MKRIYYSGYYELKTASLHDLILAPYYRLQASSYIRARLLYKDKSIRLTGLKLYIAGLIFILSLPLKLIQKLK